MNWTLALLSLAVVASSLLGGLLPLWTALTHTRLQLYLSLSAGAMLGAAFFHMLPEAVEQGSPHVISWTAWGLLALFFLERFFAFHHHESPADPQEPCPTHAHDHSEPKRGHAAGLVSDAAPGSPPREHGHGHPVKGASLQWGAAAIGLMIHSLTGGVALASAWAIHGPDETGKAAAWGVALATIIHKPADSLTIVSLMLRDGLSSAAAHAVNFIFSMMVPAGVMLFFFGMQWLGGETSQYVTACCLAFSAGTFLCIALSDLLPELQFHDHDRFKLSIALLSGFGLMALTMLGHSHD